jgi:archaellum component FlaD/FlaE
VAIWISEETLEKLQDHRKGTGRKRADLSGGSQAVNVVSTN